MQKEILLIRSLFVNSGTISLFDIMNPVQLYLIIINIITYVVFAVDKKRAIRGAWRIPEATLLGLSVVGGSIGGILAMRICRHKTRHMSFTVGLPLILILQVMIFIWIK